MLKTHIDNLVPRLCTALEARRVVMQAWKAITRQYLCHLVDSMPQHCQVMLQTHGGHTSFWVGFWNEIFKGQNSYVIEFTKLELCQFENQTLKMLNLKI